MKTNKLLPIFILVLISMIGGQGYSETEEVQKGNIDFGMNPLIESTLKSADVNLNEIAGALVSITGENGQLVYDKEFLDFYTFGESFVTERLSLDAGHFSLSEFLLLDVDGKIIWATPLENSELAHLVDDPLPMHFSITPNTTTHVRPQVVWVGNHNPGDFGYVSFDVDFVSRFCIGIEFISECGDWYMNGDSTIGPDGAFAPVYPAHLFVLSGDELILDTPLFPGFNTIFLPRGYKNYTIIAKDCYVQPCYKQTFEAEELLDFACRQGQPLLINCSNTPSGIVITPEDVFEPTIKQGVFGRLTISYYDSISPAGPCYDSISPEEFAPYPVVRDVYLYRIAKDDSIDQLIVANECNVYPVTDMAPHMIIRSNSSGYYQARIEAGRYLYMILTENGFYIDMYLSSRLPGELIIREGELTIQDIVIHPCYWIMEPNL